MLAAARHPIHRWEPEVDFAEQSSEDIWQAAAHAVRESVEQSKISPGNVNGIGFDATCSLVLVDASGAPVTVSPTGDPRRNVILWMDHRAADEADRINRTEHEVLDYVGGRISPEMEPPKLLWLKRHLPESWERADHFFDLADYLVYRATGHTVRSECTTVCKWTYLAHEASTDSIDGWADDFWRAIGLDDLVDENYRRIGRHIRPLGQSVGEGLTRQAADSFGLRPATAVAVSAIDAHAGGIGLLGSPDEVDENARTTGENRFNRRLALIGGTSSCHMAVSQEPRFIDGIWGPYYSAMIPGMWLTEGGQSATGALIDHVIYSQARSDDLERQAEETGKTVYELLNEIVEDLSETVSFPAQLTRELHVLPYFHGNRSPRADASLRGMISGLRLSDAVEELALVYLATIQSVAHGTRHIIDEMNEAGYAIDTIVATGGGTKNPLFLREHADITGCRLVLPRESEAVLLGSAMLGAVAGGEYAGVVEAMDQMSGIGSVIESAGGEIARYHEAKHRVFHRMYEDQRMYRQIMEDGRHA
jgi:FGGY-family pentulose kinase